MARVERYTLFNAVAFGISATVTSAAIVRTNKNLFVGVTEIVGFLFRVGEASSMIATTGFRAILGNGLSEQFEGATIFINATEVQNLAQPLNQGCPITLHATGGKYLYPFESLKIDFTKDATAATVDGVAWVYFADGF